MLEKINCWKCRFFQISWSPKMPYTCRLYGIKSKTLPCLEVLSADGRKCRGFLRKKTKVNKKKENLARYA